MTVTSHVIIHDRPDVDELLDELFDIACHAAGHPDRCQVSRLDVDDIQLIQTRSGQGAHAKVSMHVNRHGGAALPAEPESDQPPGHALLLFTTTGFDREGSRVDHALIVTAVGDWLNENGMRWSSQFEDEQWTPGLAPFTAPRRG